MSCAKTCTCGCCEGTRAITPRALYSLPGQDSIAYRIGEHGSFFETMKARLASTDFPALKDLGARTIDDPSIAMLDAWATLADVLTFYQERLANEGYLRTATERRSVTELVRLIGYTPRPGVAATVYLAYEIDQNAEAPVEIPVGSKVQSLPGPGELPQTFETSDKFIARKEWNAIRPRLERQQFITRLKFGTDKDPGARAYLVGVTTNLKANDALLIEAFGRVMGFFRVTEVTPDAAANRALVRFAQWNGAPVPMPAILQIRRAILTLQQTPLAQFPEGSVAQQILAALGIFLNSFYAATIASPPDPGVEGVLRRPALAALILSTIEKIREIAVSSLSDEVLLRSLEASLESIDTLVHRVDEVGATVVAAEVGTLNKSLGAITAPTSVASDDERVAVLMRRILAGLSADRSVPPRNSQALERHPANVIDTYSDVGTQAVAALAPTVATTLATATQNAQVTPDVDIHVYAFRQKSLLFGASAPQKVTAVNRDTGAIETDEWSEYDIAHPESTTAINLEAPQEKIRSGTWVVMDYSAIDPNLGAIQLPADLTPERLLIARAGNVNSKLARSAYSISGQTTQILLLDRDSGNPTSWFIYVPPGDAAAAANPTPAFQLIRRLVVYAESEKLYLALEPIDDDICGGDQWIETDGLYTGLETGRWLTVSGERADVIDTTGVQGTELVMLDAVRQYVQRADYSGYDKAADAIADRLPMFAPGEKLHTFIKLTAPLAYCYKRSTVQINANVVKATHGETRTETLGSGDASSTLQTFALKQAPLTFVPANKPSGASRTLDVYVNGVEWHEAPAMLAMGPATRGFITTTSDDVVTSVVFGNGVNGARLPTGINNVTAIYRSGIGKPGNVKAGQISQLLSRPLGVKGVNNPIEAAGGADRETRDHTRKNAPLAVMALDRLVSTRDYADFTRTFAGIGKAASARLAAGGGEGVYVTIAGIDDIPIPTTSDLYANLVDALRTYGDPSLPVRVDSRELLMLVLSARIYPDPDYLWEDMVDRVRVKLLDRYSFDTQELGHSVVLSEIIALIQGQRGVKYVDVEALGAVSQLTFSGQLRAPQEISAAAKKVIGDATAKGRPNPFVEVKGIRVEKHEVLPAQIAFFIPTLPETLLLNRIED
ncbi:MAG: putative baseplate assembly protein [Methylocella sp.]